MNDKTVLPPLPEGQSMFRCKTNDGIVYTSDQMREYARSAVLAAATPGQVEAVRDADEDTAAQEIAGLKAVVQTLVQALKRLSFAAQTTGGTAGRDEDLVYAIKWAERAVSIGNMGRAYCNGADGLKSASVSEQKGESKP